MLAAVQVLIFAANLATWDGGTAASAVDLNAEANITAWWSSTLLLAVAVVAAVILWCERRLGRRSWHWALMALGFVGLSLEEVGSVHERFGDRLNVVGNVADWPLLYLPVLLLGAVIIVRVARDLAFIQAMMVLGGLALYVGVVVAEVVSMWTWSSRGETFFEEGAELAGTALILLALAWHAQGRLQAVIDGIRHPAHTPV